MLEILPSCLKSLDTQYKPGSQHDGHSQPLPLNHQCQCPPLDTNLGPSTMVIVNPSLSIHQRPPWESVGEEAMKGKLPTLQWETNHINELDGVGDFLWVL